MCTCIFKVDCDITDPKMNSAHTFIFLGELFSSSKNIIRHAVTISNDLLLHNNINTTLYVLV